MSGVPNGQKTACPQGHPYTPANIYPKRTKRTLASGTAKTYQQRRCRTCWNLYQKEYAARRKAQRDAAN